MIECDKGMSKLKARQNDGLDVPPIGVHHAARRRGSRVAARGARATAGSTKAYRRVDGDRRKRS
jgi:hypothetical protein